MNIFQRVKGFARDQSLLLVSLAVLCAAFETLSVFVFSIEKRRTLLLLEYNAQESAAAFLDFYRQGVVLEQKEFEHIIGFAVYNGLGKPIIFSGDTPDTIDIQATDPERTVFDVDLENKTAEVIKRIDMYPSFMGAQSGVMRMRGMPPGRQQTPAAVYVLVDARGQLAVYRLYVLGQVAAPVVFVIGFAVIMYILLKNWEYRSEIASKKHLVHLGEAARTLSHEIKNPLSAIQIQAAILRKIIRDDQLDSVAVIEEEVGRLRNLVDRIGEFLRNPAGNPARLEVASFLTDMIARLPWPVEFGSEVSDQVAISFDADRFQSLFENLLKNAVESTDRDSKVEISVTATREGVRISVLDRGDGIDDEDRDRLFDPLFTTKDTGMGIGLAISRRFTEAAGGTLTLLPRKEGGTEARIDLPRIT